MLWGEVRHINLAHLPATSVIGHPPSWLPSCQRSDRSFVTPQLYNSLLEIDGFKSGCSGELQCALSAMMLELQDSKLTHPKLTAIWYRHVAK